MCFCIFIWFPANSGSKCDQFNCGTWPSCAGGTTGCPRGVGGTTGCTGATKGGGCGAVGLPSAVFPYVLWWDDLITG